MTTVAAEHQRALRRAAVIARERAAARRAVRRGRLIQQVRRAC